MQLELSSTLDKWLESLIIDHRRWINIHLLSFNYYFSSFRARIWLINMVHNTIVLLQVLNFSWTSNEQQQQQQRTNERTNFCDIREKLWSFALIFLRLLHDNWININLTRIKTILNLFTLFYMFYSYSVNPFSLAVSWKTFKYAKSFTTSSFSIKSVTLFLQCLQSC